LHRLLSLFLGTHGKTAALMLLLAAASAGVVALQKAHVVETPAIVLEHVAPLSASIRITQKGAQAIVAFDHEGEEPVALSTPRAWQLLETRGNSGAALTSQESGLGFEKWILPQHTGATFHVLVAPPHLDLLNLSPHALHLRIITVHLEESSIEERTVLVKGRTGLW
jgi:hypothetical protein